jgi:23S rRNA (adenine1618-N6)-methyltransferase
MKDNIHTNEKTTLHPRNLHRLGYDFEQLIACNPELGSFVMPNKHNQTISIDFANPDAVKALNKSLLHYHYHIAHWDIPAAFLCPAIPGRVDYIHHIADLLAERNEGKIPRGKRIKVLDIGVGANTIYPLLGHAIYGWNFTGSDIDQMSIRNAEAIVKANGLEKHISVRMQHTAEHTFEGIINKDEHFDFTLCNPPFHNSPAEANEAALKKIKNLGLTSSTQPVLNFGGKSNELWCKGGEGLFIRNMVEESVAYTQRCFWFSTLVSKRENLTGIYETLEQVKALEIKTIDMAQGQKVSRIVAWTFLTADQQAQWTKQFWK